MNKARNVAFLGIMLSVIVVLSWLEFILSSVLLLPPHVKLGLANIVTMYCVLFVGKKSAFTLSIMKSLFVLLTRGPIAGLLSFCGGVLSIVVIILLVSVFKDKISYVAISVAGALAHNLGQLGAMVPVVGSFIFISYLPIMIIFGIVTGVITGILLKVTLPLFNAINLRE
ncbi:MAG: Gx transporter family protein [Firmicutes bacterium]|nr:Gx transporter family protein [Bacillota bacterium]